MAIRQQESELILENEWMMRVIDTANGIATTKYNVRPGGKRQGDLWYSTFSFEKTAPFEASMVVDGVYYEAAPFVRPESGDLWKRLGCFGTKELRFGKGDYGDMVDIVMESCGENMPEMELTIRYEVCEDLPFLGKKLFLKNCSQRQIELDEMSVDILKLFDRKVPLSVFANYYTDTKKADDYYMSWTRMQFPDEIGMVLDPGETFESFDAYEAVTGVDRQDEAVMLHRIYKRIAPWIRDLSPMLAVGSCQSMEDLRAVADEAKENGFELVSLHVGQVFTNTGDYIPRPDIFPNGYEDVKRIVSYYHEKGIRVLPYCSATIAWRDTRVCMEHEDWQCLGPDGLRYEPAGYGNMCYHSPWGDYIREKLLFLVDEIGFDGLALDGPVHGLVCEETGHKHKNAKCVNTMNWQWERKFYGEVAKRGKIITAPETWNALLMGISDIPGGYREEDQNDMGGLDLVTMTRACVYETRYVTPSACVWTSFNIEDYHGHNIEASEENTVSYEHSVAGMYGYGIGGSIFGRKPYIGEKTKALYFKWLDILRTYRETMQGEFVHLAQPTGYAPDAMMHVSATAPVPGLVVVFNPTDQEQDFACTLPLRYAEMEAKSRVMVEGNTLVLDGCGNVCMQTRLAPFEVKAIPVERV